jgi:hypothetical protein
MTKKDDEVSVKTTDTPTDLENVKTLDKIIVRLTEITEGYYSYRDGFKRKELRKMRDDLTTLRDEIVAACVGRINH